VEVGARDVQRLPLLAKPAPGQSYAPMADKPVPFSHEPPRHAEGTSELSTKLREKGLMDGRSLIPYMPILEAPTYADHVKNREWLNRSQVPRGKLSYTNKLQIRHKVSGAKTQANKYQMLVHCMQQANSHTETKT